MISNIISFRAFPNVAVILSRWLGSICICILQYCHVICKISFQKPVIRSLPFENGCNEIINNGLGHIEMAIAYCVAFPFYIVCFCLLYPLLLVWALILGFPLRKPGLTILSDKRSISAERNPNDYTSTFSLLLLSCRDSPFSTVVMLIYLLLATT